MNERAQLTQRCAQLWLDKAARLTPINSIEAAFEKFFSVFVAYNILYSHAAIRLLENDSRKDHAHATRTFALWVGHERIMSKLNTTPITECDLRLMRELIRQDGPFFLYWKPNHLGIPQSDVSKNSKLRQRLVSDQPVIRTEAILEYIYQVRCNIFHGTKALVEPQKQILEPSTRCLMQIVELGMEKLSEETTSNQPATP